MYDEINKKATADANAFKNSLQYLIDEQNKQNQLSKKLAETNYQNTLNQINQSKTPIEQQYQENARQAYANKMLAGRQMGEDLTRLGLDTTGFGMAQRTSIENQYSSNLNSLATDRDAGLRELDLKALDLKGDYDKAMLQADIDYSQRMTDLNKYINQQVEAKYQDAYDRFYDDYKYQQQLKQQAIENQMNWTSINARSSSGGSGGGSSTFGGAGESSIGASGNIDLSDTGHSVGTVFSKGLNLIDPITGRVDTSGITNEQHILKGADGRYYIYDKNSQNFLDITDEYQNWNKQLAKIIPHRNYSSPNKKYSSPNKKYSTAKPNISSSNKLYSSPNKKYSSPNKKYPTAKLDISSPFNIKRGLYKLG